MHPIALREFRYSLTDDEERELVRLVEKQMRCSDPHIVKPLGALQTLGLCPVLSVDRLSALRKALMLVHAVAVCCRPGADREARQRLVHRVSAVRARQPCTGA